MGWELQFLLDVGLKEHAYLNKYSKQNEAIFVMKEKNTIINKKENWQNYVRIVKLIKPIMTI